MEISSTLPLDFDDVYCIIGVSAYAVGTYVKKQRNKEKTQKNRGVLALVAPCSPQ